jgi:hypothetical protein
MKEDIYLEKEFILGVKVPSLYGSSLWSCFTVCQENLSGLKSHGHFNLIKLRCLTPHVHLHLGHRSRGSTDKTSSHL